MATARAIVTADTPGCRDTVVKGENGFVVPPRDARALAAAMERFLHEPALAGRMGRRSVEIARDRFDATAVSHLLLREMGLLANADACRSHVRSD
jgi:glycosyltransferase involved in cell wall biosynthesis